MSLDQRSAARLAVVQALYQMEVAGKGINEIFAEFESHWIGREIEGDQYKPAELEFFRDVLNGVLREPPASRSVPHTERCLGSTRVMLAGEPTASGLS